MGPLSGLCYYQLGRAGAIIVGPTTTRNGSGFPSAKDATHEQEIPAGLFAWELKALELIYGMENDTPRAAADIARLPALLLPSYCYMKTIIF